MKTREILPRFPHQFFYFTGLRARQGLGKLSGRLVPASMAVYEKAQGFWVSRAIVAACELNLAEHLAREPRSIIELALLTGTDEGHLYRLMRMLAGEGIFQEMPGRIFKNTRLSLALAEGEGSMKYLILHQFCETNQQLFSVLSEVLRTGESQASKVLGKSIFHFLEENPGKNTIYNKAMDDSSGLISLAILSAYDFSGIGTLVDVGGGHGILLARILSRYKDMQGILFDQPHVVAPAHEIMRQSGITDRMQIVPGNFFEGVPAGGDAYLMKNILHAFNDEDCGTLLRKVRDAMDRDGKLLILEAVVSSDNKPSLGKRLDLLMMVGTEGGKERTREEFELLLGSAGFRLNRVIRTVAPFCMLEAVGN